MVLSVRGHVGLLDVVLVPSTLACPCVATLVSPRIATLGSPWERVACNFLIIFNHCFFLLLRPGSLFSFSLTVMLLPLLSCLLPLSQTCGSVRRCASWNRFGPSAPLVDNLGLPRAVSWLGLIAAHVNLRLPQASPCCAGSVAVCFVTGVLRLVLRW